MPEPQPRQATRALGVSVFPPLAHDGLARSRTRPSRFEACEADGSQQLGVAHSDCSRGLVRLWLRHGTLLGAL